MIEALDRIFDRYRDRLETRAVLLDKHAIEQALPILHEHLGDGRWLVVADEHTDRAAGARVRSALKDHAAGSAWWYAPASSPDGHVVCDDETIERCRDTIRESGATGVIGIGAGTLNDVAKFAADREGVPAACVGTAPSMNGYTSGIAAVLSDGVKTTQACTPTRVVILDVDVLAEAPMELIQSGLGDLASKPVSNADWIVANRLTGSTHSSEAELIIEESSRLLDGIEHDLARRDRTAVARLAASLILSGFAMRVAGNSAPASGGEHLISHYLDMVAIAAGEPHDLHGRQVGVATIVAAYLYQRLRDIDPASIDPDARAAALAPWSEHEALVRERFGSLAAAVLGHSKAGYPDSSTVAARLAVLRDQWTQISAQLDATLRPPEAIEAQIQATGGATRFSHLGVDRERAFRSIVHSRDIRARYTILDLAWELGHLDRWARDALERYA